MSKGKKWTFFTLKTLAAAAAIHKHEIKIYNEKYEAALTLRWRKNEVIQLQFQSFGHHRQKRSVQCPFLETLIWLLQMLTHYHFYLERY